MPNLEIAVETPNWQVWHTTGEKCPPRTIPIRRTTDISHSKYPKPYYTSVAQATRGHKVFFDEFLNYKIKFITRGQVATQTTTLSSSLTIVSSIYNMLIIIFMVLIIYFYL